MNQTEIKCELLSETEYAEQPIFFQNQPLQSLQPKTTLEDDMKLQWTFIRQIFRSCGELLLPCTGRSARAKFPMDGKKCCTAQVDMPPPSQFVSQAPTHSSRHAHIVNGQISRLLFEVGSPHPRFCNVMNGDGRNLYIWTVRDFGIHLSICPM